MSSVHCILKYDQFMEETHKNNPILISDLNAEIFSALHQRNLKEEFKTDERGLSNIACMCPACPFFKQKMTGWNNADGINLYLLEHYSKWHDKTRQWNHQDMDLNYMMFEGYFI